MGNNNPLRARFLAECRTLGILPDPTFLALLDPTTLQQDTDEKPITSSRSRSLSPSRRRPDTTTSTTNPAAAETVLRLSGHAIDRKSLRALCRVLESDSYFKTIVLADAYLGDDGTVAVCNALKSNSSVIRLDLRGNNIQRDGAMAVAELIKANSTIEELVLEWNSIGLWETSVHALGDALAINATLRHLDLRNNKLSPAGMDALCSGMRTNSSLMSLDVRWNNAGHTGGMAMASLFQFNTTLTCLETVGNDLSESVIRLIDTALDRNARSLAAARDAVRLHDAMASATAAHADLASDLRERLRGKDAELESLRTKLATVRGNMADERARADELQRQVDRGANERESMTAALRDLRAALDAASGDRSTADRAHRAASTDLSRRLVELESQLTVTTTERDALADQLRVAREDADRRRERERRTAAEHLESIDAERLAAEDRITAVERAKDIEMTRAAAAVHRKLQEAEEELADRERELREARVNADERRRALEKKVEEAEDRARSSESARVRQLDGDLVAMRAVRDAAMRDVDRLTIALAAAARDAETHATKAAQEKAVSGEVQRSLSAQLAVAQAEVTDMRLKMRDEVDRAAQATADAQVLYAERERARADRRDAQREVDRLREDVRRLEAGEEKRRRGELDRLKELESAFGSYIHGAIKSSGDTNANDRRAGGGSSGAGM
ncbi:hypothetical protein BC828DRAFT_375526 [Blastocladiella britannica]|nr:hypothetical protein BC828DRAFT_375526 [Blastocladiella britannica]